MWEFLELEEQIGRYWHRLVGKADSYSYYSDDAVTLDSIRSSLSVFFRGMGGAPGIVLAAGTPQSSGHRLKIKQRLGMDQESMPRIECNAERMLLPAIIACFPSAALNRRLYFWLAAYFAVAEDLHCESSGDSLQTDLAFLHNAYWSSLKVCNAFPGLARDYQELCQAFCRQRPERFLSKQEQAVEAVIQALLGKPCLNAGGQVFLHAIKQPVPDFQHWNATAHYHTFLPVPLWGKIDLSKIFSGAMTVHSDQDDGSSSLESEDQRKKKSRRERLEQSERDDPMLLNRFEKLISWSEMVNVNRAVQDDDEETAKEVAEKIEEIVICAVKNGVHRFKQQADLHSIAA